MAVQKVALVTASSAGLGAAIAKTLISQFRVVINYNSNAERAKQVFDDVSRLAKENDGDSDTPQPRVILLQADVSKRTELQRLVSETVSQMGRLDAVVSNAGWTKIRNFADLNDNVEEDDWDRCFNVNVKSHLFLLEAAKAHLEATEGAFVTVASVAGIKPSGSSLPYAVTKAAQIHLVKCLAGIVSPKIRVNSVSPGLLMTDWGRQFPEEKIAAAKAKTLLDRFATIEEVADQVKHLVVSRSMTGQNVVVDSGFSLN